MILTRSNRQGYSIDRSIKQKDVVTVVPTQLDYNSICEESSEELTTVMYSNRVK